MKTLFFSAVATATLLGVALNACSSDTTSSGGGGGDDMDAMVMPDDSGSSSPDAGSSKDAAGEASSDAGSDAGGECNTLTNTAPEATSASVKGDAPAATGGTIVDGKYYLTAFTVYDPNGADQAPSPSGMKTVLTIAGNVMDSISDFGDGENHTFSETFTVNGTALDRTLTCPKSTPDLQAVYTVSGSDLTIYETDPQAGTVGASVYAKQ